MNHFYFNVNDGIKLYHFDALSSPKVEEVVDFFNSTISLKEWKFCGEDYDNGKIMICLNNIFISTLTLMFICSYLLPEEMERLEAYNQPNDVAFSEVTKEHYLTRQKNETKILQQWIYSISVQVGNTDVEYSLDTNNLRDDPNNNNVKEVVVLYYCSDFKKQKKGGFTAEVDYNDGKDIYIVKVELLHQFSEVGLVRKEDELYQMNCVSIAKHKYTFTS